MRERRDTDPRHLAHNRFLGSRLELCVQLLGIETHQEPWISVPLRCRSTICVGVRSKVWGFPYLLYILYLHLLLFYFQNFIEETLTLMKV